MMPRRRRGNPDTSSPMHVEPVQPQGLAGVTIGREAELRQFQAALQSSRMIFITGPEGVGKSHFLFFSLARINLQHSIRLDLKPGDSLCDLLNSLFGGPESAESFHPHNGSEALTTLVIDDLDTQHDIEATAALLSSMLQRHRKLQIVATSSVRPTAYGITEIPLTPLDVPESSNNHVADLRESDAVQLHLRLSRVNPTPLRVRKAAARARHLEGFPLAIVLDVTSPEKLESTLHEIAERVFARFERDAQMLLATCGLFRGPWSMDIASRILAPWISQEELEETIGLYVRAGAIQRIRVAPGRIQFQVYRHLRSFGQSLLRELGLLKLAEKAITDAMLILARDAYAGANSEDHIKWTETLTSIQDELEQAWLRLTAQHMHNEALELVTNLWTYWRTSGALDRYRDGLEWSLLKGTDQNLIRARALSASGVVHHLLGHWEEAASRHQAAISLAEQLGDAETEGNAWVGYGDYAVQMGDLTLAERAFLKAESIFEAAGLVHGMAEVQLSLANLFRYQNRHEIGAQAAESALLWLGTAGDQRGIGHAHAIIGRIRVELGEISRATFHLLKALDTAERVNDYTVLAETLEGFAQIAADQQNFKVTARLLGAAARRRTDIDNPGWPTSPESLKLTIRTTNAELGGTFDKEFGIGQRQSWASIQNFINELRVPVPTDTPTVSINASAEKLKELGMSARLREVLLMLAEGAHDREIAESLNLSVRTVHNHVHSVITRLNATSRAGAVASAWRMGLLE